MKEAQPSIVPDIPVECCLQVCLHRAAQSARSAQGRAVSKEAAQLGYGSLLGHVAGMLLGEALKDKQVAALWAAFTCLQ
jgi:hypothetical protein